MVGLWLLVGEGGEVSLVVVAAFGRTDEVGGRELLDKVIMVTPPPPPAFLSFAVADDGRLPFLSLTTVLMVGGVYRWVELQVQWVWLYKGIILLEK